MAGERITTYRPQYADNVELTDNHARRGSFWQEEEVAVTFSVFPKEKHENVLVSWGCVKPVAVTADLLVKALKTLGYKVTKETTLTIGAAFLFAALFKGP